MDITVQCQCGQNYEFEIEPVNGVMPCGVNCPSCNADGTQLANEFIARANAGAPVEAAAPVMASPATPTASGLRINRPPPSAAPAPSATPPEPPRKFYPPAAETRKPASAAGESIPLGILGGVIAGSIAMTGWYFLTVASEMKFGIVAWFMGAFVGVGVRMLGREGTAALGYVAALCAMLAILGGDFLVASHYVNQALSKVAGDAYDNHMVEAREAVNAKTDDQIKAWLVKNGDSGGQVTTEEIEEFRTKTQTEMQKQLDDSTSRGRFEKAYISQLGSFSMRFGVFKKSVSLFSILWVAFGIASAYKIGSR
ncbi:MAG: hypothetical protein JWR26_625 [Pedosphaera sp.]|nr:hypothetical protein [Pedosphaera sp.]